MTNMIRGLFFILFLFISCSSLRAAEITDQERSSVAYREAMDSVLDDDLGTYKKLAEALVAQNDRLQAEHESLLTEISVLKGAIESEQKSSKKPIKIKRTPIKKKARQSPRASGPVSLKESENIKMDIEELKKDLAEMNARETLLESEVSWLKNDESILSSEVVAITQPIALPAEEIKSEGKTETPQGQEPSVAAVQQKAAFSARDVELAKKENQRLSNDLKKVLGDIEQNQKKLEILKNRQASESQLGEDIVTRRKNQKEMIVEENKRIESQIEETKKSIETAKASLAEKEEKYKLLGVGELDPLAMDEQDLKGKITDLKNAIDGLSKETAMIQDLLELKKQRSKDFFADEDMKKKKK